MARIIYAAVSALALGFCSTAIYAEDIAAASFGFGGGSGGGSSGGGDKWSSCKPSGCDKEIPIKLTVEKKCEINNPTAIVLNTNGTATTRTYTIKTNTHYVLNLSTTNGEGSGTTAKTYVKNTDGNKIETVVTTALTTRGSTVGPAAPTWGANNYSGIASDTFTVNAKTKAAVDPWTAAGEYTDTYKIDVWY